MISEPNPKNSIQGIIKPETLTDYFSNLSLSSQKHLNELEISTIASYSLGITLTTELHMEFFKALSNVGYPRQYQNLCTIAAPMAT